MLETSLTTLPVWGCLPICLHPHSFVGFPVHQYVLGISACDMGTISLCWRFEGVFPHLLRVLGASAHGVSICFSCTFFLYVLVVHYVSHFYYGYDYYSSSYSGVFWAVICFISDCGSFPDGTSYNMGSA